MPARLIVHFVGQPSRVAWVGDGDDFVLGRDPESDLAIDDDRVSRRHARLAADAEGWSVHDLGSKNGTWIDGTPANGQRLAEHNWVSLGGLLVEFRRVSPEARREAGAQERLRWSSTLRAQRSFVPSLGREELLQRLVRSALEVSAAERGFVLLRRGDEDLEVAASQGVDQRELASAGFLGSVGAIERVLASGVAVATGDAQARPSLAQRPSIVVQSIRALVCLPLDAGERRLGVLYLDSRREGATFDELDVEILSALASHAALAVAVTSLQEELERLAAAGLTGDAAPAEPARVGDPAPDRPPREGAHDGTAWSAVRRRHGLEEADR
jgi:pSer/pThr/pTyr-binding forkhead associated (FHA) protein